jgi:hypothetical protein
MQTHGMWLGLPRKCLCAAHFVVVTMPLQAFTIAALQSHPALPKNGIWTEEHESASMFESLKQDVFRHPADFITFETQTSANRFIGEHEDAQPEIERRIASRGIVGYWRGKTLVVLPSLPTGNSHSKF